MKHTVKIILTLFLIVLATGCTKPINSKPKQTEFTTWDIIEKTEERAPKGLKGEFLLAIKNSGKQSSMIFLNTQKDYRDRRNITVTLLPSFQKAFKANHDVDIRSYYEDKTLLVRGEAKRVKIWFTPNGKKSEKYYFQTHIIVSDLAQISVQ